jgi:hypothetical protein
MNTFLLLLLVAPPEISLEHGPFEYFEASSSWSSGQVEMANLIVKEAHLHNVDPYFMVSLAMVESGLRSYAINKKAKDVGLFQINYRWHREHFKITRFTDFRNRLLDPTLNTRYAIKVLKNMSRFYACKGRNLPACFHAGPGWRKSSRKEQISLYVRRFYNFKKLFERKYPAWRNR